jgi:hypothetical protein
VCDALGFELSDAELDALGTTALGSVQGAPSG